MKQVKLSQVKPNKRYMFEVYYNYGFGSGSSGTVRSGGLIKEVNAEFIRIFKGNGTKQSFKVNTRSITKAFELI